MLGRCSGWRGAAPAAPDSPTPTRFCLPRSSRFDLRSKAHPIVAGAVVPPQRRGSGVRRRPRSRRRHHPRARAMGAVAEGWGALWRVDSGERHGPWARPHSPILRVVGSIFLPLAYPQVRSCCGSVSSVMYCSTVVVFHCNSEFNSAAAFGD